MPTRPDEEHFEESTRPAPPPKISLQDYYAQLVTQIDDVLSKKDARSMGWLGRKFLSTVETGVPGTIKLFLDRGMPVDYQDPRSGQTALHAAASSRARQALRLLLSTGRCDFLKRDTQGRLASEIAFIYGQDPAMARLLGIKERQQAKAQGIKLTRRPAPIP